MKTALLFTDFSKHSRQSLSYVIRLLDHTGCSGRILIIHHYQLHFQLEHSQHGLELQSLEARKMCEGKKIEIDTLSLEGNLSLLLPELIEQNKADFLVLGLDKKKNATLAEILMQQKHCPLLLTHHEEANPSIP